MKLPPLALQPLGPARLLGPSSISSLLRPEKSCAEAHDSASISVAQHLILRGLEHHQEGLVESVLTKAG